MQEEAAFKAHRERVLAARLRWPMGATESFVAALEQDPVTEATIVLNIDAYAAHTQQFDEQCLRKWVLLQSIPRHVIMD